MKYHIQNIPNYPLNGNHLECVIEMPFAIYKGVDPFWYTDKNGKEHKYGGKTHPDKRWVCGLRPSGGNVILESIFYIKAHKDLDKILAYCKKKYIKSLKMELKRIEKEVEKLEQA